MLMAPHTEQKALAGMYNLVINPRDAKIHQRLQGNNDVR